MTATSDRKVVIALISVFVLILIGAAMGIYRNKANELQTLRGRLKADQARLADVKEKVNRMPQLELEFGQLQDRLSFLERPLPSAAYIPTFLRQIEQLALDTNNRIASVRPQKKQKSAGPKQEAVKMNAETGELVKEDPAAAGAAGKQAAAKKPELPYDFVPIQFKMEGTYWTTLEFLKKLQRFPKMIAVNTVDFQTRTSLLDLGANTQGLTVTLDLTAVATKGAKDGKSQ